jgi:hypothetical protein
MTTARLDRLSPSEMGEDEGEGLERASPKSTLTLPLSLRKGEATRRTHHHARASAQK